jgi:arginyl-tRNA synthetase
MVDVFGADHIATYPDVLAGLKALGEDPSKVKVLIHQFVTIVQEGEVVKMSTRKANFVTLDELIAEVGADVVRYFFLMRTIASHLNFDLGLARSKSWNENPVFYIQYAHARVRSVVRRAEEEALAGKLPAPDFELLSEPEELLLVKSLLKFPDVVESCAATNEPHRLTEYLYGVAGGFHHFYQRQKILSEDLSLSSARLALCEATDTVVRNGLAILGISAPEKM